MSINKKNNNLTKSIKERRKYGATKVKPKNILTNISIRSYQ